MRDLYGTVKKEVIIMKQIIVDNISTWYYITEDGKCYNSKTNNWLKGQINYKNGYKSFNIILPDGSKKRLYAHRMVAIAFIPNSDKTKTQINHIDGNKLNNHADNLEWVTPFENQLHELRQYNHVYCFNKDKQLIAEYPNIKCAAESVKCSTSTIISELHKEKKALACGFYWNDSPTLGETITYTNTGKAKKVNQYDLNGKYIMTYPSTGIAAKAIGGVHSHISQCCRGKLKTYKGFIWRYTEDIVSSLSKDKENV